MSVLRRKRSRPQAEVEQAIRHELSEILPILRIDHCAIELDAFDPATGTATLFFKGGCPDCDASAITFLTGIETQLKLRVSEIQFVTAVLESHS
jgi:Fe-S cluster biogenesis protein NfuA